MKLSLKLSLRRKEGNRARSVKQAPATEVYEANDAEENAKLLNF
jgi:hypothetical protein